MTASERVCVWEFVEKHKQWIVKANAKSHEENANLRSRWDIVATIRHNNRLNSDNRVPKTWQNISKLR